MLILKSEKKLLKSITEPPTAGAARACYNRQHYDNPVAENVGRLPRERCR
jgi:hypothetical protein